MEQLVNLKGTLRGFWDENITQELTDAGIEIHPILYCDSPQYTGTKSIQGKLNDWIFSRDYVSYSFWGDVPLAMAKRIANDQMCRVGSIPKQWLGRWKEDVDPEVENLALLDRIRWIAPDGFTQALDKGYSDEYKNTFIHEANGRLRFVDDPSVGAEPFIRTYTFFTLAALKRFVEISNEERVPYKYTR